MFCGTMHCAHCHFGMIYIATEYFTDKIASWPVAHTSYAKPVLKRIIIIFYSSDIKNDTQLK